MMPVPGLMGQTTVHIVQAPVACTSAKGPTESYSAASSEPIECQNCGVSKRTNSAGRWPYLFLVEYFPFCSPYSVVFDAWESPVIEIEIL